MRQKFLLILFGVVISVLLSEISLRLGGYIYYNNHVKREEKFNIKKQSDHDFIRIAEREKRLVGDTQLKRIICIGDSWTFGLGAAYGYSYPTQLQRILDEKSPGKYKVYNGGIPGYTSKKILKILPKLLHKYEPNIVIILVGSNDIDHPYLDERIYYDWKKSFFQQLKNVILDLRIYRLIRLGVNGFKERINHAGRGRAAEKNTIPSRSVQSKKCVEIGRVFYAKGESEFAKKYYEKAIKIDLNNESAYIALGHLFQSMSSSGTPEGLDKALFMYERLLTLNPYTSLRNNLYSFLFQMYQRPDSKRDKIKFLIKKIPSDKEFRNPGTAFVINRRAVTKNLTVNFKEMIGLIKSQNAKPVFQTYFFKHYNDVVRVALEKNGSIFVNNGKIFQKNTDQNNYLVKNGHPNEEGYRVIAENVYKKMMELR